MVPDLVRERPAEYLAVFGESLVRKNTNDASVIYLYAFAEVVPDINSEDIQVVVLRQGVQTSLIPEYHAAVELTEELCGHFIGNIVKDIAALLICHPWSCYQSRKSLSFFEREG